MRSIIVTLVVLAGLAVVASGQPIYPMQQERSIHVLAQVNDPNSGVGDDAAATDFEPWLRSAYTQRDEPGVGVVSSTAEQLSEIDGTRLSAYGLGDIEAEYRYHKSGHGISRGLYHVRFAVAAPVVMQISGALAVAVDGEADWPYDPNNPEYAWSIGATTSVRVRQVAGSVVFDESAEVWGTREEPTASQSHSLSFVAVLGPGVYELDVVADVTLGYLSTLYSVFGIRVLGELSYIVDVEFQPVEAAPECTAADIDTDSDVDLLDFYHLQQCFEGPQ